LLAGAAGALTAALGAEGAAVHPGAAKSEEGDEREAAEEGKVMPDSSGAAVVVAVGSRLTPNAAGTTPTAAGTTPTAVASTLSSGAASKTPKRPSMGCKNPKRRP